MSAQPYSIDDLKTERSDIAPPLPQIARLVPLLFYVSVFGAIALTGLFTVRLLASTKARDEWVAKEKLSKQELLKIQAERKTLEGQAKRASDLQIWTESTRGLQPLVVDLARGIESDASLIDMHIARSKDDSKQLKFSIRINASSMTQLDQIVNRLQSAGYRTYSPEQKLSRSEIDYQTTLIWQPSASVKEVEGGSIP